MLEGIDDIDWPALTHAYGPADDISALLRAAGSPDAALRDPALDELNSSLCHQGSIYPATAAAVPFIARLALEGPGDRLRLMWLLHGAAEGSGPEYREVRRAVAVALPSLLGLAADEDPAVRRALVWTVAVCEDASLPLLPLLRARLAEERDAEVRADLVTALGLLDVSPETGGARARALLAAPEPPVRRA
ncbi:HEAT repeat domain-containing protein, partial [Streptomyces niveus]